MIVYTPCVPCFSKPCLKLLICEEVKSKGRLRRERHIVCTCFFCSTMFYPHSYVSEEWEKTHIFFAKIAMPAKKTHVDTVCWQRRDLRADLWVLGEVAQVCRQKNSFCRHTLSLKKRILLTQLNHYGYICIVIPAI